MDYYIHRTTEKIEIPLREVRGRKHYRIKVKGYFYILSEDATPKEGYVCEGEIKPPIDANIIDVNLIPYNGQVVVLSHHTNGDISIIEAGYFYDKKFYGGHRIAYSNEMAERIFNDASIEMSRGIYDIYSMPGEPKPGKGRHGRDRGHHRGRREERVA